MNISSPPEIPDELVYQLREANQSLVIASLRAQELQDQAEASNKRLTEFLSMLAHELRNPLAPIALAGEMLEKISASHPHPQLPKLQQIIARQAGHMKRLLDDLLDASRVSSGKAALQKSRLLLTDVVQGAVEISQPSLAKKYQELIVDLPPQPIWIDGDAVRLSQVFSNLLLNASKFSPGRDPITLSARLCAGTTVEISIKDQGVGIEPDTQAYIFDLFAQGPRTLGRTEGGLGIGLFMVRALVEMHGGTVQVRSSGLDCGSEFIVVLPVSSAPAAPEANPASDAPAARSCQILLIEDNVDQNETLNFFLTLEGHRVDSAFDGPAGLEMAKGGRYDLVISDLGLPGMDGFEVLEQIGRLQLAPMPCWIAMTGYDQQRARAIQAGFDYFLVKPVSMATLREVISERFPLFPLITGPDDAND